MSDKATILSFTLTCPVQRDTAHAPVYDAVHIDWGKRTITVAPCPACGGRHRVQLAQKKKRNPFDVED